MGASLTSEHQAFSEAEAAKYLGVARGTLTQWRYRKCGPVYSKINSRVVYYRERLDEFRREREVRPEAGR